MKTKILIALIVLSGCIGTSYGYKDAFTVSMEELQRCTEVKAFDLTEDSILVKQVCGFVNYTGAYGEYQRTLIIDYYLGLVIVIDYWVETFE